MRKYLSTNVAMLPSGAAKLCLRQYSEILVHAKRDLLAFELATWRANHATDAMSEAAVWEAWREAMATFMPDGIFYKKLELASNHLQERSPPLALATAFASSPALVHDSPKRKRGHGWKTVSDSDDDDGEGEPPNTNQLKKMRGSKHASKVRGMLRPMDTRIHEIEQTAISTEVDSERVASSSEEEEGDVLAE